MTSAMPLFVSGGDEEQETVQAPAITTLTCPECNEEITGKARGAGSAVFKLATHRRVKHGVAGQGKGKGKRPKPGAPTEAEHMAHPIASAVREVAAEVSSPGSANTRPPSTEQLAAGLGRGLGISSLALATLAVSTDPMVAAAGQEFEDKTVESLTMPESDATALMRPIARLIQPTSINTRYGRQVVDNVDVVGSLATLFQLAMNWRSYLLARAEFAASLRTGQPMAAPTLPRPDLATDLAGRGLIQNEEGLIVAPPNNGQVLSFEDVQRLQAQAGGTH